jgi:hypothetical protein
MLLLRDRANRVAAALYALGLALFVACAVCSFRRHVHVDELSSLYSIQLGAAFGHGNFALIELNSVLLRPLARVLGSSQRIFVGFRWFELSLLLTLCWTLSRVQRALPSAPGRAAVFIGAIAFGPLWRHGFEVRHDMYVAFEVVLLAWAAERARSGRWNWFVATATGLGVILVQANSFKAFVLWAPGMVFCALLGARGQRPWMRRFLTQLLSFVPGLVLGLALVVLVLGSAGMLGDYLAQLSLFAKYSSSPPYRLSALPLLTFAFARAPVHAACVLIGLVTVVVRLFTRKDPAAAWVPFGMFCLSLFAIAANPTPFPYNLTWLTPAWLLMSAVGAAQCFELASRFWPRTWAVLLAGLAAVLAVASFVSCETDPYYRKNWDSQLRIVAGAEALTRNDEPVLDLCGLVISRPPVAKDWFVHSLLMPAYHAGQRETVRHIIERVWPPVAVRVYRWGFLDRSDLIAFNRNYVRFSNDLWTLGSALTPNVNHFEIHRSGRYQARGAGELGTVDGQLVHGGSVLSLNRGTHAVAALLPYTLAWTGPGAPEEPPPPTNPLFEQGELPGQRDSK